MTMYFVISFLLVVLATLICMDAKTSWYFIVLLDIVIVLCWPLVFLWLIVRFTIRLIKKKNKANT
jgi:phosphotransferase system  glucose/maltose/N-acetylglucosamine-specific IIC component